MGKKNKSKQQIDILTSYYQQKPHMWSKHDLFQISKKTGLKKHQVYKWLWDQRNIAKLQNQSKHQELKVNYKKHDAIESQNTLQKCSKVTLISQRFNVKASLPVDLQSPQYIKISNQTSQWAQKILANKGWELLKCLNQTKYSQKKVGIFDVVDEKKSENQDLELVYKQEY